MLPTNCSASRVLPLPPGPVMVTRRLPARRSRRRLSSCRRPTKVVSGIRPRPPSAATRSCSSARGDTAMLLDAPVDWCATRAESPFSRRVNTDSGRPALSGQMRRPPAVQVFGGFHLCLDADQGKKALDALRASIAFCDKTRDTKDAGATLHGIRPMADVWATRRRWVDRR